MWVFSQTKIIDGYNIYSPFLLEQKGDLKMYFGGWKKGGETQDAIYRANCPHPFRECTGVVKVIDPARVGLKQVNDPTVIRHSDGYYIMYMTAVPIGADGYTASNNHIYYSTSWVTDGINWSVPKLLTKSAWLPSATKLGENIELFANSNANGRVVRLKLGKGGTKVLSTQFISASENYLNVDVVYRPALKKYQILAERSVGDRSVVDYVESKDGVRWSTKVPSVISPSAGQFRVNAPAAHPKTHSWVYYGQTASTRSLDFSIYFREW